MPISYRVVEGWEHLPAGWVHGDCAGVSVDADDNVYVLTRSDPRLIVYSRDGRCLRSWGEDLFTDRTHGVTVAPDGRVYCVDDGAHCVYAFDLAGGLLLTIGSPGIPSDTGYDGTHASIRGGPPFNRPTNLAVAPSGDLYVSDGYGNCRVHRFSRAGELVQSWGEPGSGPGQFNLPHGIAVDARGNVLVADRENDRIQVFDAEGALLTEWTDVQRPTNLAFDREGRIYVSELRRNSGDLSYRLGRTTADSVGRFSVFDSGGGLLARVGGPDMTAPGGFIAPHDIAVDSRGDVYVAEVTLTFGVRAGLVPPGSHDLQKLELR